MVHRFVLKLFFQKVGTSENFLYCYNAALFDQSEPTRVGPIGDGTKRSEGAFYLRSSFSPCERYVAAGRANKLPNTQNMYENTVILFDTHSPEHEGVSLEGTVHDDRVTSVRWSPTDSAEIVSCADDGTLCIWAVADPAMSLRQRKGASQNLEDLQQSQGSSESQEAPVPAQNGLQTSQVSDMSQPSVIQHDEDF